MIWYRGFLYAGLPLPVLAILAGALGVLVLMDVEQTGYLAQTQFGQLYTAMVRWNPFTSAFVFNFGLIGTVMISKELHRVNAAAKEAGKGKKEKKLDAKLEAKRSERQEGTGRKKQKSS